MSVINIIILVTLLLVLLWGLNNIFFKTNILYDQMCEASVIAPATTSLASTSNIIVAKDIPDTTSSNFMLSVWFYIDNWNNNISNEKNILFLANNKNSTTPTGLTPISGISSKINPITQVATSDNFALNKNINIALDKYENNLLIDIECLPDNISDSGRTYYTRYKIPNVAIQKWNNLTISVDTRTLDVYLDGKLRNSFILHGLYKSFYDTDIKKNIYLGHVSTNNIGFEGFITRVRYIGDSINPQDAYNIYKEGINASLVNSLFNKYSLKVSFLEYNNEKASFKI